MPRALEVKKTINGHDHMKKPNKQTSDRESAARTVGDAAVSVAKVQSVFLPSPTREQTPTSTQALDGRSRYDTASALSLYIRDVGKVELLTVEEEIQLAARIKKGDVAARDHMICANLRLVIRIARQYESIGLPLLDLINENNLGLMKAVERFDPGKGGKLATYGS